MELSGSERETGGERLRLFLKQQRLLETFLEHRAISRAQYERSLRCMAAGMGVELAEDADGRLRLRMETEE